MRIAISAGETSPKYSVYLYLCEDGGVAYGGHSHKETSDLSIKDAVNKLIINKVNEVVDVGKLLLSMGI